MKISRVRVRYPGTVPPPPPRGPLVKPLPRPVQKDNFQRLRIREIMPRYMDKLAITGLLQKNNYGIKVIQVWNYG